jgi:hypothetical protein
LALNAIATSANMLEKGYPKTTASMPIFQNRTPLKKLLNWKLLSQNLALQS